MDTESWYPFNFHDNTTIVIWTGRRVVYRVPKKSGPLFFSNIKLYLSLLCMVREGSWLSVIVYYITRIQWIISTILSLLWVIYSQREGKRVKECVKFYIRIIRSLTLYIGRVNFFTNFVEYYDYYALKLDQRTPSSRVGTECDYHVTMGVRFFSRSYLLSEGNGERTEGSNTVLILVT